jgi:hypothetical protein
MVCRVGIGMVSRKAKNDLQLPQDLVQCAALFCTYQPACAQPIGQPGCLLSSSKPRVSSRP